MFENEFLSSLPAEATEERERAADTIVRNLLPGSGLLLPGVVLAFIVAFAAYCVGLLNHEAFKWLGDFASLWTEPTQSLPRVIFKAFLFAICSYVGSVVVTESALTAISRSVRRRLREVGRPEVVDKLSDLLEGAERSQTVAATLLALQDSDVPASIRSSRSFLEVRAARLDTIKSGPRHKVFLAVLESSGGTVAERGTPLGWLPEGSEARRILERALASGKYSAAFLRGLVLTLLLLPTSMITHGWTIHILSHSAELAIIILMGGSGLGWYFMRQRRERLIERTTDDLIGAIDAETVALRQYCRTIKTLTSYVTRNRAGWSWRRDVDFSRMERLQELQTILQKLKQVGDAANNSPQLTIQSAGGGGSPQQVARSEVENGFALLASYSQEVSKVRSDYEMSSKIAELLTQLPGDEPAPNIVPASRRATAPRTLRRQLALKVADGLYGWAMDERKEPRAPKPEGPSSDPKKP